MSISHLIILYKFIFCEVVAQQEGQAHGCGHGRQHRQSLQVLRIAPAL